MMSKYQVLQNFRTRILLIPALVLATTATLSAQQTTKSANETSRLATYETASGETSFALSLKPNVEIPSAPADVVVLFDTSASQNGLYRNDAIATLRQLVTQLNDDDRVSIFAVDVRSAALTDGFVSASDENLAKAVEKIERRIPLGATDLPLALKNANSNFDDDKSRTHHVVYIGDGMSTANIVDPEEYKEMIGGLVAKQTTFSSYAIGPDRDLVFLAAIANQTGGNLFVDSDQAGSATVGGTELADTVHGSVIWPETVKLSDAFEMSFPSKMPPLRTDRDTILIGSLKNAASVKTEISGVSAGKPVSLSWETQAEASNPDFSFLPQLVSKSARDGGISMPLLGSQGLRESGRVILASSQNLLTLSQQAAARGSNDDAKRLANAALENDPENQNAESVQKLILKREDKNTKVSFVLVQEDDDPFGDPAPAKTAEPTPEPAPVVPANETPAVETPAPVAMPEEVSPINELAIPEGVNLRPRNDDDDILAADMRERERAASRLTAEVEATLKTVQEQIKTAPTLALRRLKIALEEVRLAPDLPPSVREQLRSRLVVSLKVADREADRVAIEERATAIKNAQLADRRDVLEATERREEEMKQLVKQFNSLVYDGKGMQAIIDVVPPMKELDDRSVIPGAASEYAQFYDNWGRMQELRDKRWRGVWLTLYQVELSSIPTPDEPPIVYPDPEFWEQITEQRAKYKAVDLVNPDGAEAQIAQALSDTATFDFFEQPLTDVVQYLKDSHRINAVLDADGLDLAGLSADEQVTKQLSGISLRSALRLLLKDLDLTYIIKDEVLQITSNEAAADQLVTKVYNVGDLVVPIPSGSGGGLIGGGQGGVGGGVGGGGMGGGGMGGGGMGGGGFGGGGMGGGGGGGGLFVVDDSLTLGKKSVATTVSNKKSADDDNSQAAQQPVEDRSGTLLPVKVGENESAEKVWDDYLSKNFAHPADVRRHSKHLMAVKRFDETVAMLSAAMRHKQMQPWMYQGLTLALQASDASEADIERAMMSALDGRTSNEDKMRVAIYMNKIDLNERAFQLLRDVAIANPTDPRAFAEALRIAQELNDDHRIVWACSGLLNQPWVDEQHPVRRKALGIMQAKYAQARKSGQKELAAKIEKEYGNAMVNDCVIKVTWTGEADVDLVVEEPAGSICSMENPRTESGGVLLSNSWSMVKSQDGEGFSESYVCPQGFAGNYRVLVKKIWGDTTAGKVKVEVTRHQGDDTEQTITQLVELDQNGTALVLFELDSGRREEPLKDHQIAAIASRQQTANRSILSQVLGNYNNSAAAAAYNRSRGLPSPVELERLRRARAGVGYRPQISVLPEGASMLVTAVVSADRRYVRVSPFPQFTQVISVSTFNFVTGQGGNGGGGGGGGIGGGGGGGGGIGGF